MAQEIQHDKSMIDENALYFFHALSSVHCAMSMQKSNKCPEEIFFVALCAAFITIGDKICVFGEFIHFVKCYCGQILLHHTAICM